MAKLSHKFQKNVSRNYEAALKHYNNGAYPQAEEFCKNVLSSAPGHADTLHLLGLVALSVGKNDIAFQLASQAASKNPQNPNFINTMGAACYGLGRLQDALNHFRSALVLHEAYPQAHSNLCGVLNDLGNLNEAEKHGLRAIELQPGLFDALANMAKVMAGLEKWDMSIFYCLKALELQPNQPKVLFQLGVALSKVVRLNEAIEQFRKVIALQPDYVEAHNELAGLLFRTGIYDQSLQHYQRALEIRDDPVVHFNFAVFLQYMGNLDGSKKHYKKVLEFNPNFVEGNSNIIAILLSQGLHKEAYAYLHKVMDFDQAILGTKDCLLMHYLYDADIEPKEIAAAHREWGERVAALIAPPKMKWDNNRDPKRPLRVGFVSGDFREHAVMRFLRDVFEVLDPNEIELYFFSNNKRRDNISARLEEIASGWWDIAGMNDEKVVELIQHDEIDILVDLAGHTTDNRLLIFVYKPAPIQVSWLGYAATTGLAAMDYRLTDAIADPPESKDWHSEELVRLPEGFLSFSEPSGAPEPAGPPCMDNDVITFGCFNNNAKITPPVISLWAEILHKMPNSRMFLKNDALRSPAVKEMWLEKFQEYNVKLDRIELLPRVDHYKDHLALYQKVDIALDVFPYNGTTTTCEAMWMGVPVVTLRGDRHVGRVSASLLTRIGLEDLIAETHEEYVEKAVSLAGNYKRISELRYDLRSRMQGTALGDANRFARTLEKAFREMWLRWLGKSDNSTGSEEKQ